MTASILDALSTPPRPSASWPPGTPLTLPAGLVARSASARPPTRPTSSPRVRCPYAATGPRSPPWAPGQIIGEAAIVNHTLRSATIVALTPLEVVHFTSERLEELVGEIPAFAEALRTGRGRAPRRS